MLKIGARKISQKIVARGGKSLLGENKSVLKIGAKSSLKIIARVMKIIVGVK